MTETTYTHTGQVSADESDLLAIGEVAKTLGVSVETVRRWDRAGHIESIRTPGGQRRFQRAEVDRVRAGQESS